MQILDPILYMIIGGCVGGLLGWFLARDQVRQYLDDLREETEERARKRAARQVKEEMSDEIRRELIDEYREEAQAAADSEAEEIVATAERDAEAALKEAALEAKAVVADARVTADEELKERRQELQKVEERLGRRESNLDRRALRLDERESELKERRQEVADEQDQVRAQKEEWNQRCQDVTARLEAISGYDAGQAKKELKERMIGAAEAEAQEEIKTIEQQAHDDAEKEARKILSIACQRYAGDFVAEKSVRVIDLPSDNMKGRIIGREGRNIRALEQATGVDIIIDDTPEVVVVSCFDPVRREIARRALEKLIADGRIHPTHIEEMVAKADQEVAQAIQEAGNEAVLELGIHGLHPELLDLVGQLKFRTSYGQNIWAHSIEVGFLCGLMAAELGVDVAHARRAGLLHDIGKAVSHERDEGHAIVGAKLAARHGEEEVVRNAIAAHHNEEPQQSVIAHLVIAADALSGARPGARREVLGAYVKRLEALERIATDFEGVQKAYAIQAGREVRVIVAQDTVDDEGAKKLSKEIAKRIESELTYPGQIVVTVIRETRAQGYAR